VSERTTVKPDAVRAVALRYRPPLTHSCRRVVSTLGRVILGGVLLAPIGVFGVPLDTLAGTSVSAATSPTGGRLTLDATLPAPWDTRTSLLPMARSRLVAATPLTLVAFVEINMNGTWDPYPATNETVAFLDGGSQLGTAPIVGVSSISTPEIVNLGKATLQLPAGLSAGTHVLTAQFAATPVTNASGSLPLTVTVDATDDWVDADSVRLAARTFFPVKDGYLDTVNAIHREIWVLVASKSRPLLRRCEGGAKGGRAECGRDPVAARAPTGRVDDAHPSLFRQRLPQLVHRDREVVAFTTGRDPICREIECEACEYGIVRAQDTGNYKVLKVNA
jgi:hypothetical protein